MLGAGRSSRMQRYFPMHKYAYGGHFSSDLVGDLTTCRSKRQPPMVETLRRKPSARECCLSDRLDMLSLFVQHFIPRHRQCPSPSRRLRLFLQCTSRYRCLRSSMAPYQAPKPPYQLDFVLYLHRFPLRPRHHGLLDLHVEVRPADQREGRTPRQAP